MDGDVWGFCRFVLICIGVGLFTGFGIYYLILWRSRRTLKKAEQLLEKNGNGILELQTKVAAGPRDSTTFPVVDGDSG